jgi:putative intracellular protease/amidase
MQEAGIDFEVVSQETIIQDEVTGQANSLARKVYDVSLSEAESKFTAIMIVSGDMKLTEAYWRDQHVLDLIAVHNNHSNPIAAICCSVPTIRGAAKGKAVSFFPLIRSRELLAAAGAILRTVAWTVDQNLCTAEHQMATQMWAESFVRMIKGEPETIKLVDSGYVPKGRPRKTPPAILALQGREKDDPLPPRNPNRKKPVDDV